MTAHARALYPSACMHTCYERIVCRCADHFAEDDHHALEIARNIVAGLNLNRKNSSVTGVPSQQQQQAKTFEEPLYGPDDMGAVVPLDAKRPFDVRKVTVTSDTCGVL